MMGWTTTVENIGYLKMPSIRVVGLSSQSYGFSSSHVWMWELDYKESWALKNWCFWTVVLEKTLESPLDCREIQPVHPKGDQSWVFIGRTDVEAEIPILWPPHAKSWFIGKDFDAGRDWGQEEKGTTEDEMVGWHHRLNVQEFGWTPGVGDGQGGLVCCNSWGHKESDMTEWLNWTELNGVSHRYCQWNNSASRKPRSVFFSCLEAGDRWVSGWVSGVGLLWTETPKMKIIAGAREELSPVQIRDHIFLSVEVKEIFWTTYVDKRLLRGQKGRDIPS